MSSIETWTGGNMRVVDALDKLRRDGFPVEDIDVGDGEPPLYDRRLGESAEHAESRWRSSVQRWEQTRTETVLAAAGTALAQLMTRDVPTRGILVEWRADKAPETAVLKLATEHCRRFSGDSLVYVFGERSMLQDLIKQGVHHMPNAGVGLPRGAAAPPPPAGYPGLKVQAYFAFMSATLAFVPLAGLPYPVTVGFGAYAVGIYTPDIRDSVVQLGVMPQREYTGVVGATVEQVAADLAAQVDAGAPPTFDPQDWKAKLRLRRLTTAKGDNPG